MNDNRDQLRQLDKNHLILELREMVKCLSKRFAQVPVQRPQTRIVHIFRTRG